MYNCYTQTDKASGGSSKVINNKYFHGQINLKTNLQAVTIRIPFNKTVTRLLCLYPFKL